MRLAPLCLGTYQSTWAFSPRECSRLTCWAGDWRNEDTCRLTNIDLIKSHISWSQVVIHFCSNAISRTSLQDVWTVRHHGKAFDQRSDWVVHMPPTNQYSGEKGEIAWILLSINFLCMSQGVRKQRSSHGFWPAVETRLRSCLCSMEISKVNKGDDGRGYPFNRALKF